MRLASHRLHVRSLVMLGITAGLAACADPVAPALDAGPTGLRPRIDSEIPLRQADAGFAKMAAGQVFGKVVFTT